MLTVFMEAGCVLAAALVMLLVNASACRNFGGGL